MWCVTELDLKSGQELYVADVTTPAAITFILNMTSHMEMGAENESNAANWITEKEIQSDTDSNLCERGRKQEQHCRLIMGGEKES